MFRVVPAGLLALVTVAWFGVVQPVTAQLAPASQVEEAGKHFALGTQLFDAGSFRDALREFELVSTLTPTADIWFNIGRAHEELAEYDRAIQAFERYLRDSVEAKDSAAVHARVEQLRRLAREARAPDTTSGGTGSLRIHMRSKTALVLVDGQRIEAAALDRPLLLAAGLHRLDISQDDYIPLHARVNVQGGLLTAAHADLTPLTRTRMRPIGRGFTWAMLGLAGLGALGSAAFASAAMVQQSSGRVQQAQDWAALTDVALVGTAVCALAATLLYHLEGRTARTERVRAQVLQ